MQSHTKQRDTHLYCQGGNDALGVHQGLVAQVVQATLSKDLGASLEPDGLTKLHAGVLGQQLRGQHAQSTQQSPAGMDQLNLPVASKSLAAEKEKGKGGKGKGLIHAACSLLKSLYNRTAVGECDMDAVEL